VLRLLADENFDGSIFDGVLRRAPELDLVRVQDVGLAGADDPAILAWAAEHGRLLLTHDRSTVPHFAYERIAAGLSMPGVIEVSDRLPFAEAIEQILFLAKCSREGEWEGQVIYLPL
jgi:hypothetical protein